VDVVNRSLCVSEMVDVVNRSLCVSEMVDVVNRSLCVSEMDVVNRSLCVSEMDVVNRSLCVSEMDVVNRSLCVSVCSVNAVVTSCASAWIALCAATSRRSMPHGLLGRTLDDTQRMTSRNSMQARDLGTSMAVCTLLCVPVFI